METGPRQTRATDTSGADPGTPAPLSPDTPIRIPLDAWVRVALRASKPTHDELGYVVNRYDVASLDRAARNYFRRSKSRRAPLLLDLHGVKYLEHECLIHLGALALDSQRAGRPFSMRLPVPDEKKPNTVIDFLRTWQFPEFISDITGRSFESVLDDDSRAIWNDLPAVSEFTPVIPTRSGRSEAVLPRSHFVLLPVRSLSRPSLAATNEQSRYLQLNYQTVLRRLLGDRPGEDVRARQIATQIINEAVKNAAMHPRATVAYTTTQIRLPRPKEGDTSHGSLEISVWDNGEPISKTLADAVASGIPITSAHFGAEQETFKVSINPRPEGGHTSFDITQRINPARYANDRLALTVGAFLSGVTSKPGLQLPSISRAPEGTDGETPLEIAEGGLGLKAIRKAAIDLLGGRVRYISGHDRVAVTQYTAPDGQSPRNTYRVVIQTDRRGSWDAAGNHLQVSIPLVQPRNPE